MKNWKRMIWLVLCFCIIGGLLTAIVPISSAAEKWLWPVNNCYIVSSNYGLRDLYGTGSFTNYHYGIDIVGASSTYGMPIRATKSGTVYASCNTIPDDTYVAGSCGNYVAINHGDGTYSIYMHMRPAGVKTSGTVRQGDVIGYIGNTGDSYGAHLHFQIYTNPNNRNGSTLNPMPTNSNITIRNAYVLPNGWPSSKTTYIFEAENVPQNPKVVTDKSTYTLGETVTITPSADEATGYNVSVWLGAFGTGERVYGNYDEFTGSTTFTPSKTGVYTVRASCINSAGYSDAECMFRVVLPAYKVSFDTNGGTLESDVSATRTVDGFNTGRPTGTLIVFNLSGEVVNTNSYGAEVAVNSKGQVISKRNYGDESQLTVPDDGFVLSGHVDSEGCGGNFVKDIEIGDYVAYSESMAKAYVYKSQNAYLASQKYVSTGNTYGSLPTPSRSSYTFDGWYTASSGGSKVTSSTIVTATSDHTLYAHWVSNTITATDSGTCGDNLTWTYYAGNQTLVIEGFGAMYDYTCRMGYCSSPWSAYVRNITSVSLPEGLTYIGNWAFYCLAATNVTIPSSVQSISGTAFMEARITDYFVAPGSTSLDAVKGVLYSKDHTLLISYPSGRRETSYEILPGTTRIGEYAFLYNFDLASVTIPDSVIEIGREAFSDTGITEITIPEGVTVIEYDVFHQCTHLTKVNLPGTLKQIKKGAFVGCVSLSEISIPNDVESLGWVAFSGCTNLKTVVFPAALTTLDNSVFEGCKNLRTVYFWGDAPEIGTNVFQMEDSNGNMVNIPGLVLYYIEGKTGWTKPTWYGYDTATWQPAFHTHTYSERVVSPSCTDKGYTTHTCVCGESYVDSYVSALGHAWDGGKVTTQPTATENGEKTFACTRCNATRTESIPATGDQNDKPCDGGEDCPSAKFVDVNTKEWYHPYVDYAVTHGLFGGTSANTFEPETAMTRAMLVTVLWRYEGQPRGYENTFVDVNAKSGSWYIDAVAWAAANNIVGGIGNNKFDPEGKITREQMATILFRYAQKKGIDTSKRGNLNAFPDGSKTASWAKDAMQWTVGEGIINGSDGKLLPQGSATRAQVATILMRFIENIVNK